MKKARAFRSVPLLVFLCACAPAAPLFAQNVEIPLMGWAPPGSFWEKLFSGIPNGAGILVIVSGAWHSVWFYPEVALGGMYSGWFDARPLLNWAFDAVKL